MLVEQPQSTLVFVAAHLFGLASNSDMMPAIPEKLRLLPFGATARILAQFRPLRPGGPLATPKHSFQIS